LKAVNKRIEKPNVFFTIQTIFILLAWAKRPASFKTTLGVETLFCRKFQMVPQRSERKSDKRHFKDVIRHVVNSAMGCVNLRQLIERIVQVSIVKKQCRTA
jgi:hypothetical protein